MEWTLAHESTDWLRSFAGQVGEMSVTTSGGGASGSIRFFPGQGQIRITMTASDTGDAIYSTDLPAKIRVVDAYAIAKSTVADAKFAVKNAGDTITKFKAETISALTRAVSLDADFTTLAAGATLKLKALSTGGSAIYVIDYLPEWS